MTYYKVTETQIVWTSSLFEKPERKFVVADYLGSYIKEWLFFYNNCARNTNYKLFATFIRKIAERGIKFTVVQG